MGNKRWAILLVFLFIFSIFSPNHLGAETQSNPYEDNIKKGLAFFNIIQNDDGGFPWYVGDEVGESDHITSAWVIMALGANGEDLTAKKWVKNGSNPLDYLVGNTDKLESTTDYARQLLALSVVEGYEKEKNTIVDKLRAGQDKTGHFGQTALDEGEFINAHMWAILALKCAGEEIPNLDGAKKWLLNAQNTDGGFAWYLGLPSDADDTAIAIQALVALGEPPAESMAIKRALRYLKSLQGVDGGFSSGWVNLANASTDSWVWQALKAAGEKQDSPNWVKEGQKVADHLLSLQSDEGCFYWTAGESRPSVIDTAYALMALSN
ncbi:MAG TPA: prenyltransferase/squalene oxidase repeat-containing protein [Syntrophomonadaceae bacterium]|nr:prenyltransferase/squalene oxidase repeat-containing protein [Syntrophomonadaceae bacterium]